MTSAAVQCPRREVLAVSPHEPEALEMTSTGFPFSYEFVLPPAGGSESPAPTAYALGDLLAERPSTAQTAGFDLRGVTFDAETQTSTLSPEAKKKKSTSVDTTTKFTGLFLDTSIDCNSD